MEKIIRGKILLAHVRGGGGAPKELIIYYQSLVEDDTAKFLGNNKIAIPMPYQTKVGDRPNLEGKDLKISIEY